MSTETMVQEAEESRRGVVMVSLFKEYRIAAFNRLYSQIRAARAQKRLKVVNAIATVAASAVLYGLAAEAGALWFWQVITGIAAVLSAVALALGLDRQIAQHEKAALGHGIVADRIEVLLRDLRINSLTDAHEARQAEIMEFKNMLVGIDEAPDYKLIEECWNRTERSLSDNPEWTF